MVVLLFGVRGSSSFSGNWPTSTAAASTNDKRTAEKHFGVVIHLDPVLKGLLRMVCVV